MADLRFSEGFTENVFVGSDPVMGVYFQNTKVWPEDIPLRPTFLIDTNDDVNFAVLGYVSDAGFNQNIIVGATAVLDRFQQDVTIISGSVSGQYQIKTGAFGTNWFGMPGQFTWQRMLKTFKDDGRCIGVQSQGFRGSTMREITFTHTGSFTVGESAFGSMGNLERVNFPDPRKVVYVSGSTSVRTFFEATSLDMNFERNFGHLKVIPPEFFRAARMSKLITSTNLLSIGEFGLGQIKNALEIYFPNLTTLGNGSISFNTSVIKVNLPSLTTKSNSTLVNGCTSLVSGSFPQLPTLTGFEFNNCTSLKYIDVSGLNQTPGAIANNSDMVTGVPNSGSIKIPAYWHPDTNNTTPMQILKDRGWNFILV
jgi:hypothetical protein